MDPWIKTPDQGLGRFAKFILMLGLFGDLGADLSELERWLTAANQIPALSPLVYKSCSTFPLRQF